MLLRGAGHFGKRGLEVTRRICSGAWARVKGRVSLFNYFTIEDMRGWSCFFFFSRVWMKWEDSNNHHWCYLMKFLIEGQQCESELKALILRNYDMDENQEDGVSSGVGTKLEDLIYN